MWTPRDMGAEWTVVAQGAASEGVSLVVCSDFLYAKTLGIFSVCGIWLLLAHRTGCRPPPLGEGSERKLQEGRVTVSVSGYVMNFTCKAFETS